MIAWVIENWPIIVSLGGIVGVCALIIKYPPDPHDGDYPPWWGQY